MYNQAENFLRVATLCYYYLAKISLYQTILTVLLATISLYLPSCLLFIAATFLNMATRLYYYLATMSLYVSILSWLCVIYLWNRRYSFSRSVEPILSIPHSVVLRLRLLENIIYVQIMINFILTVLVTMYVVLHKMVRTTWFFLLYKLEYLPRAINLSFRTRINVLKN